MWRVSREMWIVLILAAATVAAHGWILRNHFVALDDQITVYENKDLLHLSLASFTSFWSQPKAGLYAPLTYSLLAAISLVADRRPNVNEQHIAYYAWPFHAVSLLLHVLTVLIVYRLLRRLIGRRWPAAAGALLFSLHPVQVETVAWVTELNGLLSGFFVLLALLFYLRSITGRFSATSDAGEIIPESARESMSWYLLGTIAFIFAMLAKPIGVMTPLLGAVIFWYHQRTSNAVIASIPSTDPPSPAPATRPDSLAIDDNVSPNPLPVPRATWRKRIPWRLVIWLIFAVPMALVARQSQPVPEWWLVVPLWLRPLVAGDALAFYCFKLLVPITLIPDYNRSPHEIHTIGWAYVTWIIPALLGSGIVWLWWKRRADGLVAGTIWFVAALLPVLGLTLFAFQRMSTVADRYLYLPMFGVSLAAAGLLARVWPRDVAVSRPRRFIGTGAVFITIAVLAALGVRTAFQTTYWHDTGALIEHTRQIIGRGPGMSGYAE